MEVEDLFRDRLVLGEVVSLRAAAGVGNVQQFQIGRDVLVHRVVAGIGLGEVEDEVGAAPWQREERLFRAVEHLIGRFVPELCQRLEDLFAVMRVFFFLRRFFLLRRSVLHRLGLGSGGPSSHTSCKIVTFSLPLIMSLQCPGPNFICDVSHGRINLPRVM